MKRYLLFLGNSYYPHGGFNDFYRDFNTLGEANVHGIAAEGKEFLRQSDDGDWCYQEVDWWHIWDTAERKMVGGSQYEQTYDPIVQLRDRE